MGNLKTLLSNLGKKGSSLKDGGSLSRPMLLTLVSLLLLVLLLTEVWTTLASAPSSTPPEPAESIALGPRPFPLVKGEDPKDLALQPAPLPHLIEETPEGKLPKVAADGQTPFEAYAVPFDTSDPRPRIGVILYDIGLINAELLESLKRLPGSIGIAFNPNTPNLPKEMSRARQAGHETLLTIPADGHPNEIRDPGPGALRIHLPPEDNLQRLRILMGKASGYIGVLNMPETAVFNDPFLGEQVLDELRHRGIAIVTTDRALITRAQNLASPTAPAALKLNPFITAERIESTLKSIEIRAKSQGGALIIAPAYPNIIKQLSDWLPSLSDEGITIAPASAFILTPTLSQQINSSTGTQNKELALSEP